MKSCHPMCLSTARTVQSYQLAARNQLGKTAINNLNTVTKTIRNKKKGKTINCWYQKCESRLYQKVEYHKASNRR